MKEPKKGPTSKEINKKARILSLFGEINEESAEDLIQDLIELDLDKTHKPITLFISSPGGDCGYGFAMIDVIEKMASPVKGVAIGEVCSMAPAIFIACKERFITKHSYIMLHPVHTYSSDYVQFAKSRLKNAEDVEKMYDDFVLSKITIPKKVYDKSKTSELWLSAEEAVKYKIASKII